MYDWGSGQIVSTWDQDLKEIVVRDNMCYGILDNDIIMRDLRQSDLIQHRFANSRLSPHSSINVFDGKIYTTGVTTDIFDMRYLQRPTSTVESRRIGPCDSADRYSIDLINMVVWGSQISWDLIDNKWERANICDYYNIQGKICNGMYLAVMYVGVLRIFQLNGSAYFPYGDFKLQWRI